MVGERPEPPREGEPSTEGTPPGGDPDYHLHSELGEEAKRLAHPREEAHRLTEELRKGETETTPFIVMAGIAVGVGLIVALLILLAFLVARFAN